MTYLYPDHLRARATLWLWDLRDIGFIGIGAVFSIACFSVSDILVPMVLTTVYGFLSIQFDGTRIRDFILYCRLPRYLTKPRQRRSEWDMAGSDGISRVSTVFRGKSLLTNKMRII